MELFGDVSFLNALHIEPLTELEWPSFEPTASEALATAGTHTGPRPYRSRRNRPCDFCRARKAACKITSAPPCILCRSYGKECTFNTQSKRKRSVVQHVDNDSPSPRRQRPGKPRPMSYISLLWADLEQARLQWTKMVTR